MRPRDFWALHPWEFWQLVEAKRPPSTKAYAGGLTEGELAEIHAELTAQGAFDG